MQTDPKRLAHIEDVPTYMKPLDLSRLLQSDDAQKKDLASALIECTLAYDENLNLGDLLGFSDVTSRDILVKIKEGKLAERVDNLEE